MGTPLIYLLFLWPIYTTYKMKKINHFYIDEAGHINNDSHIFLYGCIKTDTPDILEEALNEIKNELSEEIYFNHLREQLLKRNFHAVDDHPDIRAAIYKILPTLNFRGYFIVTNKSSDFFAELKSSKKDYEILSLILTKLITPRVTKNGEDKNIFYFETLEVEEKSLNQILTEIFSSLKREGYDVDFEIVGKDNITMGIIDYINYNLYQVLDLTKKINSIDRNYLNFEILKEKFALINILDNDSFFSRFGKENYTIEIDNLRNNLAGL